MTVQAKLTAIAVTLKRIAAILAAHDTEPIVDESGIAAPKSQKTGGTAVDDAPVFPIFLIYFAFSADSDSIFVLMLNFDAVLP